MIASRDTPDQGFSPCVSRRDPVPGPDGAPRRLHPPIAVLEYLGYIVAESEWPFEEALATPREGNGGGRAGDHGSRGPVRSRRRADLDRDGSRPIRLPRMKDIAAVVGVSQSTVSRVLNNKSVIPITAETRERVLAAAARLGYRPNPAARALRGARTMLIGAVVRDITDPFFAAAIEALCVVARDHGYNVVLGHAHGSAEEAMALATVLESRHCDAILLMGDMRDQPRLIEDLGNVQLPVVALWQGTRLPRIPSVDVDNRRAIWAGVDHLVELGHTRIAFVGGSRGHGDKRQREASFRARMRQLGLVVPEGYLRHVPNTPAGGGSALRALMELEPAPTAVIAATDVMAIGILHAAAEVGIGVPRDLSVIGFDDQPLAAYAVPPLTTLRMPTVPMVLAAFQMAIDAVEKGAARTVSRQVFQATLIERRSTAPPR